MITAVLGAPGSGKTTITPLLASLLPGHVILDWDAFMVPAAALAGREIRGDPACWPAYRLLVRTVVEAVGHLPVVLLGVCTPAELDGWPLGAWFLLDCADEERQRRLGPNTAQARLVEGLADGRAYRELGLPVIDSTGRTPDAVAAELASRLTRSPPA